MASGMVKRVAFAAVAIPVAVAAVWFGGLPLAGLIGLLAALGARELVRLGRLQGLRPWGVGATFTALVLPLLAWAAETQPEFRARLDAWPFAAALWLLAILVATLARLRPEQKPLGSAAVTVLAPLYTGGLPAFALVIRHAQHGERSLAGAALLLFPLVVVWVCDSVAMEVGRRVGGPKLAPTVSPGKTWAGTVGGFLGALAVAPLYQLLVFERVGLNVTPWHALIVGAVAGSLGQVGDLVKSLLKREAGVKDSGRLFPGHGGVLDRLDSLYFAVPLTAALYRLFGVA